LDVKRYGSLFNENNKFVEDDQNGDHPLLPIPGNRQSREDKRAGFGGSCLVGDIEHFNFLPFEKLRTCKKGLPVQSGVVGVTTAKVVSVTVVVCVAVIVNINVEKC
jgi:hypothetical protein